MVNEIKTNLNHLIEMTEKLEKEPKEISENEIQKIALLTIDKLNDLDTFYKKESLKTPELKEDIKQTLDDLDQRLKTISKHQKIQEIRDQILQVRTNLENIPLKGDGETQDWIKNWLLLRY